ncbi:Uncharacterized conserved protein YlxW, UPF0749 family [Hathewaya proteolytica DSM 3090]|uniref:Uncharacterized conserved protein YlxW, UPF0749 family n=1 Tax=Hathewaya proteolytica DSM 3090 TaxID=1121331 RepID=A0A1M6L710_9CLOT|nr:DUF881 domain-containing protein [Hathewaya proteolytica]SHJ66993.1 Uncharacterized conserved protein YlxW, UPF0749 family [Hathewaya proteolytica DSM 3090]
MKKNEATIFVFIASIVVGILISMNIKFSSSNDSIFLSVDEFNEEYNRRNALSKNIRDLKKEYDEAIEKLSKYESNSYNLENIESQINDEVRLNEVYLGHEALVGKGLHITLNDAKSFGIEDDYFGSNNIHDTDLLYLINDLRIAGAEAISINGNRVMPNSYTTCGGVYIEIDGAKMVAPFYIDVIGNPSSLKDYILSDESHMKILDIREMQISISESEEVEIPAYAGDYNFKHGKIKK